MAKRFNIMIYIALSIILIISFLIVPVWRAERLESQIYAVISNQGELITSGSRFHCLERINAQIASDKAFRIKRRAYKIRKLR